MERIRRVVLAAAALALAVWVLGFASRGLLSGDSGVKLAQADALWRAHFTTRALPDPPGLERFPAYGDFVLHVDGRRQGIYSLTFTALAAPLTGVLGSLGMMLLGLAGGVGLLYAVDLLAGRLGLSSPARLGAALVTVGLTPVLLYSAQFAEHTPAVALTIAALALVAAVPTRPLLAGALVALAATMRAECYLACATVGLALVARDAPLGQRVRDGGLYLGAALSVLALYWAANLALSHTWDPIVTFQKAAPDRWANVQKLLIGEVTREPGGWLAILVAVTLASFVPGPDAPGARAIAGGLLIWLALVVEARATGRTMIGTFSVTPIAGYGLVAAFGNRRWRPVWIFAVGTTLAIVALNKSNDAGGLQLGARLVLPALPALIVLAAAVIDDDARARRWALLIAPAALLALTAWMFARALPPAYAIAAQGGDAARAATEMPGRVIVTRVWWESQVVTPALLDGKTIVLAPGPDLAPVLGALAARGVDRAVVVNKGPVDVTLPDGRRAHDAGPARTAWLELHDVAIERAGAGTATQESGAPKASSSIDPAAVP